MKNYKMRTAALALILFALCIPKTAFAQTSSMTLPDRRLTEAERNAWIADYRARGGATAVELEVVRLINIERANLNLSPVAVDETLMMVARFFAQQANDLRAQPWSTNFGPYADNRAGQRNAADNVAAAFGASFSWGGSHSWFSSGSMTAQALVTGWMNSGTREVILSPEYRFVGVGQFPGGISYLQFSYQSSQNSPVSSITLPNRRLTEAERNEWIADYLANGGPTAVELEVVRLINIERANLNLSPVVVDDTLMMAARFFAQQANDLREFHTVGSFSGTHNFGPYTDNPAAQHGASANVAAAFGGRLRWGGGNWFSGGSMSAQALVTGWMNSPGHRAYIVSPEHRFMGAGQFPGGISYMFMSDQSSQPIPISSIGQPAQATAAPPAAAQTVQRVTSSIGIATLRIHAGTFTMGSPANEVGRNANEGPQRQVTISEGFWMGVYPVTQEEWTRVMGSNPSGNQASNPMSPVVGDVEGRRPVVNVNWYDAIVFANRLSIMEGLSPAYRINGSTNPDHWGAVPTNSNAVWNAVEIVPGSNGWRLPTEAQWEYSVRAGTPTAFSNGMNNWQSEAAFANIGWFSSNSGNRAREVGRTQANPWGLHDMHGNVWEWVWDWFGTYPNQAQTDPSGESSGTERVLRGGRFNAPAQDARSAARFNINPSLRIPNVGFRLVRP
ncbi:MAG: SUMF1/EgtB/PvdO family nonheme iron enzyme [Spirochaetes bacterium]|nr:SUMF1/EgtB/PvdO family nonheme iron enzyme [Spirochaetota bacterium]